MRSFEVCAGTKACSRCREVKPLTEFYRSAEAACGYKSACKACANARNREHNARNVGRIQRQRKERYERLIAIDPEYGKKSYQKHMVSAKQRSRAYYHSNKDMIEQKRKAAISADPKLWARRRAETKAKKPELYRSIMLNNKHRRRSAMKAGALSAADWRSIVDRQKGRCFYCSRKRKLEVEHVIPLSKGGEHRASNVVGSCRSCNAAKQAKYPHQFAIERGRLVW